MQLYLIRHAQSQNNVIIDDHITDYQDSQGLKIYENQRFADAPLSERGYQQAEQLGEFLVDSYLSSANGKYRDRFNFNNFDFTHLFVSPMIRTMDTAKPFVDRVDLKPIIWEDLHEQGGVWNLDQSSGQRIGFPGVTPEYIRIEYPDYRIQEAMNPNGWWSRPYEEPEDCYKRSGKVLEALIEQYGKTEDRIAIVTHSYFINCILYYLFNLSTVNREYIFVLNNASITRIDFVKKRRMLVYQNRTDFLTLDLIT
ncbi:MAG: histidine phosphatase family protein [Deltaproteobacteria bacterium]|nr:histidine phosphatase family protein [Deltaproteobacteria bacterium]